MTMLLSFSLTRNLRLPVPSLMIQALAMVGLNTGLAGLRRPKTGWSSATPNGRICTLSQRSRCSAPTKKKEPSCQTRYYISSLEPDPEIILAASRSHWSVENNVHWQLDVSLREDDSRTRTDHSARNLAMIRRAVLNMARREPSKMSLKRKRLKAALNKEYRVKLLAC